MNLHVGVIGSLIALTAASPPSCQLGDASSGPSRRAGDPGPELAAWLASGARGAPDAGGFEMGLGCEDEAATCEPGGCPEGTRCLADGCGRQLCQPAGLPCLDAEDCPSGSACVDGPLGSVCARAEGCADARDCSPGFACEEGACRDRRVLCAADADCPDGAYCELALARGAPVCHPVDRPCAHDAACPEGALCLDLDGDGELRCTLE